MSREFSCSATVRQHSLVDRSLRFFQRLSHERRTLWGVEILSAPSVRSETCTAELAIAHPAGLAAFAGYLKRNASTNSDGRVPVFCRGESADHEGLTPCLLRKLSQGAPLERLLAAEERLESGVKKLFGGSMSRFTERDISALLQHYGVRTTWVDLVDNLFVAVWFALTENSGSSGARRYDPSKQKFGWIKFVEPWRPGLSPLRVKDLRCEFLQHSLRPHAQHGVSVTRWTRSQWNEQNTDLREYVIGKVRIPNDPAHWRLTGFMFGDRFLFPGPNHDHTYRFLLRRQMTSLLREIEKAEKLRPRVLGVVDRLEYSEPI